MLATPADRPPAGSDWIVEAKLDGYRLIAHATPGAGEKDAVVRLFTRSERDVTAEMPAIAAAVAALAAKAKVLPLILDGEAVVQEDGEAPRFQAMQRFRDIGRGRLRYYVFDLLRLGETDLTPLPLVERRAALERLLRRRTGGKEGVIQLTPRVSAAPEEAFETLVAAGHEGVILKRANSRYVAGQRSDSWLKLKRSHTEDLVVGGFTHGRGARGGRLGALLVGASSPRGLVYTGHVGTGFNAAALADLHARLTPLETKRCPFVERPPLHETTTWVHPETVVEVKFNERTADGILRFPVYIRVRDDKSAEEVAMPPITAPKSLPSQRATKKPSREAAQVLEQLEQLDESGTLEVGHHAISITSLTKVMWPARASKRVRRNASAGSDLTKRDLLRYLTQVSPALLAHLKNRPVTLTRYPNGAGRAGFYQRHWDAKAPSFAHAVDDNMIAIDSLVSLLYAGQLGALEFHPWYVRSGSELPDFVVFDLDSYLYAGHERVGEEPAPHAKGFDATRKAAWLVKGELDALGLPAYVKTSGKTGLHVFVPIKRKMTFDETHAMAQTVCQHLESRYPKELTTVWATERRRGKVFLDYNQNRISKTLAGAYSPRAASGAPISLPITWDELDRIVPEDWTIHSAPDRLATRGDPWSDILAAPKDLRAVLKAA